MQARLLEGFHVFQPIYNPPDKLDVARPLARPSPALQGAGADCPAASQMELAEMVDEHIAPPRLVANNCGERQLKRRRGSRGRYGGKDGGIAVQSSNQQSPSRCRT